MKFIVALILLGAAAMVSGYDDEWDVGNTRNGDGGFDDWKADLAQQLKLKYGTPAEIQKKVEVARAVRDEYTANPRAFIDAVLGSDL